MPSARRCPACAAPPGALAFSGGTSVLRCPACRSIYAGEVPGQSPADAYQHYYGEANLSAPPAVHDSLARTVAGFAAHRSTNRLLDVGFGAGALLDAARAAGWEATGIEASAVAVARARDRGLTALHGELREADLPAGGFDVICAVEVIEHVPEPAELLGEMARLLRPGGLCWLTTPHAQGLSARLLGARWSVVSPPEHLQLFSQEGIRRLLADAGLREVRLRSQGVNPLELWERLAPWREEAQGASSRVQSGYRLLEATRRRPVLGLAKDGVNALLRAGRLGDSLRVAATRDRVSSPATRVHGGKSTDGGMTCGA